MKDTIIEKLATLRQKENQYHNFLNAFIGTLSAHLSEDMWKKAIESTEEYCKKHKKEK
jgi:hypothetical protein